MEEEEKGDLPLDKEEAGEDLKMSEDPDGAIEANQQSMPKKRGRKPKVILDPSSSMGATKSKPPKRVELSTTIEVPEKVSWTVTYFSRCSLQIKEWKDKKEQFDAILKSLLKRQPQESPELRVNLENCALPDPLISPDVSDDTLKSVQQELNRIGQEYLYKNTASATVDTSSTLDSTILEQVKLSIVKLLAPLIDSR